ncbi:unnamed protein product, partial [Mesorhabditis spiculigera]
MVKPNLTQEVYLSIDRLCGMPPVLDLRIKCRDRLTAVGADLAIHIEDHQEPKAACKAVGLCKGGQFCFPN